MDAAVYDSRRYLPLSMSWTAVLLEGLFLFNDTIEGPRAPAAKQGA